MGLVINANIPCNTVGFPTNKEQKPLLKIDVNRIADRYDDLGIIILKPHLDRLAFGFTPTQKFMNTYSPGSDAAEYKQSLAKDLWHSAEMKQKGLRQVTGVPFKKKPWANYKINIRFQPSDIQESVLIQVSPKNPASNLDFMRFDMNPAHFTKKSFAEFRAFIKDLLVIPGENVTYETFLTHAAIYRADIAVDILGARPADLEIIPMVDGKPAKKKSHVYKSATGRAETVYPGAKKGKTTKSYIYDKRIELEDNGKPPMYGDFLHSRFECRIGKTSFSKLAKLNNRCGRVSVRAVDVKKFAKLHYHHKVFLRYALERNLPKALELVPPKFQPKMKKSYDTTMRKIWNAEKLWSFWKQAVKTQGLF